MLNEVKSIKDGKIALVHDYIKEYGGAESVLETLSDIFPDAQIYTSLYKPQFLGPHRERLEKKWSGRIHQSFFQYIPFARKIISPLRLLSPLAFRLFNFSSYDLIISSATGAYFPNSLNKKSAKLICYCHTPPRYLYGLATSRNLTKNKFIWFMALFANHWLRLLDYKYAQNVDQFIANSSTTALRIKKYYRRSAVIINPPVDIKKAAKFGIFGAESSEVNADGREHRKMANKQGFFITGGRLAFAKRYDIAIEACNLLKLPLKVFGRDFSGNEEKLRSLAGPTIEFLGEITNEEKIKLLSQSKGFIFCSDNEDFGIIPVEAMAAGCPVIAYRSGGTTETVIEGKTGVFFDKLTPQSCANGIQKLSKTKISPQACITQADKFSQEIFVEKIKKLVRL